MKRKNINQWLIYIALLGIGITIGDCIDWGYFEMDKSISVIDAFTLFITIGLTWYIATILEKKSKNEQYESDLIVEQIDEVVELLKDIDTLIHQQSSFNEVILKVHCIGLVKQDVFDHLMSTNKDESVASYETAFKEKLKSIKDLLTNTPIDKNDQSKISIKEGMVTYTDIRIKEIVTEMYSFRTELFKLKLFVTRK